MTKEITLTKNKVALVSDEDFEYLNQWKWQALFNGSNFYATRSEELPRIEGKRRRKTILMHREIAGIIGLDLTNLIDHRDRNSLNNQRQNLRAATSKQNGENISLKSNNKSGCRGVYKSGKRWVAQIKHNYKQIYLGTFTEKREAIKARLEAEKILYTHSEVCI